MVRKSVLHGQLNHLVAPIDGNYDEIERHYIQGQQHHVKHQLQFRKTYHHQQHHHRLHSPLYNLETPFERLLVLK